MMLAPGLCGGVSCSPNERCGIDTSNQMERCMSTCTSDDMCMTGQVCGAEGLCETAGSVVVMKAPESGCQEGPSSHKTALIIFALLGVITLSRRPNSQS